MPTRIPEPALEGFLCWLEAGDGTVFSKDRIIPRLLKENLNLTRKEEK